jgi:ATP-dependent Lon protease
MNKNKNKTVTLPVYRLDETPTVLLPGILYRVSFSQESALEVIQFFKGNKQINNLLLSTLKASVLGENAKIREQETSVSEEAIAGGREFRKFFNGNHGDESAYDWLILGLLPRDGDQVCTVSRIVGISNDSKGVVITFQALTRGHVGQMEVMRGSKPKELNVEVFTNKVEFGEPFLNDQVKQFNDKTKQLFDRIETFLQDFVFSNSKEKADSQGKKFALTLSPLANALHVQFSGDYKSSSAKLKTLIENFNVQLSDYSLKKSSENFLKLLDLTVAILPVDKGEFLAKTDVFERIEFFHVLISSLNRIFITLYNSVDYVEKFYSTASNLEKSKIISNQLKSIKLSLESMKPNSGARVTLPRGKTGGQDSDDNEELQLIQKFLANIPSDVNPDGAKLLKKDFKRLQRMVPQHSEYQVLRTYFDVVLDIPFGQYVNFDTMDIRKAAKQLDDDHFGLYHVKKRLLQFLSVLKLHERQLESNSDVPSQEEEHFVIGNDSQHVPIDEPTAKSTKKTSKSPILLFVGPPGVGKTSLAKSIATALGRKFQRISLGGIRDESEIRGHRRTYVGSMPGVVVNALRKAGSMNPVILLDEIDKVSGGVSGAGRVNGDPAAALLEVLDPEQNVNFTDHYLGFPIDLSNVLFLCTANELATISAPLRDRTEIIEISGYTLEEKCNIGSKYLLPKQIKDNGLKPGDVILDQDIWKKVVSEYIREAGVRNLERKVGAICRGKAVEFVENEGDYDKVVKETELVKYLGLPTHPISRDLLDRPKFSYNYGVVNGLSYNSDGSGGVLVFEIISIPTQSKTQNSPSLVLTGRLGETLTESIKIGVSFIKSIISRHLISGATSETLNRFNNSELHLHVPMGGIAKDGPSAGITITLALLSIALHREVPSDIAMTGEITLRGKVLPIGGVSEKLLGASQYGIRTVLVPKLNRKDVIEGFYNDDVKLMELVSNDSNEPEKLVKEKLGIDLIYVDTFWDVIKAVWGNDVVEEHFTHL